MQRASESERERAREREGGREGGREGEREREREREGESAKEREPWGVGEERLAPSTLVSQIVFSD